MTPVGPSVPELWNRQFGYSETVKVKRTPRSRIILDRDGVKKSSNKNLCIWDMNSKLVLLFAFVVLCIKQILVRIMIMILAKIIGSHKLGYNQGYIGLASRGVSSV